VKRVVSLVLICVVLTCLPTTGTDAQTVSDNQPLWTYSIGSLQPQGIGGLAISADGQYIVVGTISEHTVLLFASGKGEAPLWSYETGYYVNGVAISADGQYVAAVSSDYHLYVFSRDNRVPLRGYGGDQCATAVGMSPDGRYVACDGFQSLHLYSRDSGTALRKYSLGQSVNAIAFSADGRYIVVGTWISVGKNGRVYLLDRDADKPLWFHDTARGIFTVGISSDGQYVVAGEGNVDGNRVYFFSHDSGKPLWTYTTKDLSNVAISSDGKYVAASGDPAALLRSDGVVIWRYQTAATSVDISSDGQYIAAGSISDDTLYLLTRDSQTPLWEAHGPGIGYYAAISGDAQYIAASSEGTVYLFSKEINSIQSSTTSATASTSSKLTIAESSLRTSTLIPSSAFAFSNMSFPIVIVATILVGSLVAYSVIRRRASARANGRTTRPTETQSENILCIKCGAVLPKSAKFCDSCGTPQQT